MTQSFFCPIPWVSLSSGAAGKLRVCCHQSTPLSDLDIRDFNNLSSTGHNERVRREILAGEIPDACRGCHRIEQAGAWSPRQEYLKRFGEKPEPRIRYLDLTIDNQCNLACIMCSPAYSQMLIPVWSRFGRTGTPLEKWSVSLSDEQLGSILPDLEMITITGGEPFVSAECRALLRRIVASRHSARIKLRLFSNLTSVSEEMLELVSRFQECEILASIDSVGENYEWIRHPAKWTRIHQNLIRLAATKPENMRVSVHAVAMAPNWTTLGQLIRTVSLIPGLDSKVPWVTRLESPRHLRPDVLHEALYEKGRDFILRELARIASPSKTETLALSNWKAVVVDQDVECQTKHAMDYALYSQKFALARKRQAPSTELRPA